MPVSSSSRLLVLHLLRVKGFADLPASAESEVDALAEEGLVKRRDGVVSGWRLTPAGLTEHDHLVEDELEASGGRAAIAAGYRDFLALNHTFLGICTDAQLDGADVVARLEALHAAITPILGGLTASLGRFDGYRGRLDQALARVEAGEADFLTRPLIDSYHTIWSELHEDLLATLGIARGSETEWLASAK